jgi:selenocysteine-specific elongation factor
MSLPGRTLIVGTAGHIDHGKSALVRALTGTDPDRLKEEKERGITIDLGFAHLDLGEGLVASFIDVPGHERFVRNMLAGAHGIDAVALVVAADESVMPQTREHFHICRLLGVSRGLLVLTKCDLADEETQALAELELRELVAGSFLEKAPLARVSARTGAGLAELRELLRELARGADERSSAGLVRLPVDRAFTLRGFGTVVTGTLVSGAIAVGDELELLPAGRRVRVRGLQVHGAPAERVGAGHRAALNLSGIELHELQRGDVLARPGTLRPTSILDVELTLLPGERPLRDQTRVRVHLASAEVLARLRVPGGGAVAPGGAGTAQLRLERPAVACRGDRLVLRSYSPAATIGGARVLDPLAPKRRAALSGEAARTLSGSAVAAARLLLAEAGRAGVDLPTLSARVGLPLAELSAALAKDAHVVVLEGEPARALERGAFGGLGGEALEQLAAFHRANPLKAGMPREELRRRAFARTPDGSFERALAELAGEGRIRVMPESVALADHEVRFEPEQAAARTALLEAALAAGLEGIEAERLAAARGVDRELAAQLARVLQSEGLLRRVGTDMLVHSQHLDVLKRDVRNRWPPGTRLDVAGFKELTGLSRKFVIPLLEYLDRERVTRRSGSDRFTLA